MYSEGGRARWSYVLKVILAVIWGFLPNMMAGLPKQVSPGMKAS